eukprot:CAMPEP_0182890082 /NCGR_PEP_ID=MMETSP0034_2-20130328/22436_1 /TAXON_ID=156128 /ORGANISM="Nephroselmis pyriformis, Strain CCMP717" /LENGTH=35 /DNA_ID= /DNA_START= /DNA_END= /DNA_ORIENTATION=
MALGDLMPQRLPTPAMRQDHRMDGLDECVCHVMHH